MHILEVLRRPIVTEKTTSLQAQNKYAFEVVKGANKPLVKEAVERAFNVTVEDVNIMIVHGRMRRIGKHRGMTPSWKKAIVTLKQGHKIELFEGV
ncbi:MAG: 50S ribosomal protein L23 [Chloroflexi bacterium]|nr:50S ribosomal protein L23 [Chloroflexota bacterium]